MINLEKEIREQPAALAKVLGDNMPTVDAIVKEAKDSGVNVIYSPQEVPLTTPAYTHSICLRFWQVSRARWVRLLYLPNTVRASI